MKKSIGFLSGVTVAVAFLVGCNNANNPYYVPTPPPPGGSCGKPANNLEVLYPRPGGRRVNPAVTTVYLSTQKPFQSGNSYDFIASLSNNTSEPTVNNAGQPVSGPGSGFYPVTAAQIPNPHANPTYKNPIYWATNFNYGAIGPSLTVQLLWNDYGTNCNPNNVMSTFTTGS
jgi:hypothetical protein